MIGDLFDSPWKILIIAVVVILLFGTTKLPIFARSLGKSMRILKTEVQGLNGDDEPAETPSAATYQATPPQLPAAAPDPAQDPQAQLDALSKQIADLQQSVAANKATEAK